MWIEIAAPASLPLGLVRLEDGREATIGLLGVTLQHPPVRVFAQPGASLTLTGARADKGNEQARRFLHHHGLSSGAEVEVELAVPEGMGLSSEPMLGLTVASALAWAHHLPFDDTPALANAIGLGPTDALPIWSFDQGGWLLVETTARAGQTLPRLLHRQVLAHPDPEKDWPFVMLLPRLGPGVSATLEADRLAALLQAAPYLSAETGRLFQERLWPALAADDLAAFAGALMAIQELNYAALERSGTPYMLTADEQALLDLMRENGALAWGRSITGLGLYGLLRGAHPSIELRQKLMDRVGPFGGWVMASITDNDGSRHTLWEEQPIFEE